MKRFIFVTGPPRTGKTTVVLKTANELKSGGYRIGGMVTREVRKEGFRVGFEILDYGSNRKMWLAHVHHPVGPRVGRYRVNLESLELIGAPAILEALEKSDVVLIDEVGPMELCSEPFRNAVEKAICSFKPVLGTIHWKAKHVLVKRVKSRGDVEMVEVTHETREKLPALIVEKIIKALQKKSV